MKKYILIPMILFATSVQAGEYWHPLAEEVRFAGPDGATVCGDFGGTSANSSYWECKEVETYGAKDPVTVLLYENGPVKVIGARWAYAWDGLSWVPMAKD